MFVNRGFFRELCTVTLIGILFMGFSFLAYSQPKKSVTIQSNNVSVTEALNRLEKQSGVLIDVGSAHLKALPKQNLNLNKVSLFKALDAILSKTNYTFSYINGGIKIVPQSSLELRDIKGVVVDDKDEPLPGVVVMVGGTKIGTTTDVKGQFSIKAATGNVINVVYIGFKDAEKVIGNASSYNIKMELSTEYLDEVVVTALGIKRSEKALSYNVQQIKSDELTAVKDVNFINSLNGKVAGVVINTSSSGIGGATRVVMRGPKSINYNNNALYVIDGVPMTNSGGEVNGLFDGYTTSDNISSFNPDDIESMSVLTGAAASSLYGSLGQNGVIIITTKSGKVGKPTLTYSNSTSFLTPFVMPRFQNTYGLSEEGAFKSWGTKLDKPSNYKPKDFFQVGRSINNSVTFTAGTEKNRTYASVASLNARGLIPSNKVDRFNFTLKNTLKLFDEKLTLGFNAMYMIQKEKNMFAQGIYNNPLVPIYLFPPAGNFDAIKSYERFDNSRNFPIQYWPYADDQFRMQNPYWIINRELFANKYNRLFLGANVKYDITNWLNVQSRFKYERNSSSSETNYYATSSTLFSGQSGRFDRGMSVNEQYYFDALLNLNKKLPYNFNVVGNLGYTYTYNTNSSMWVTARIPLGAIPNLFNTGNVKGEVNSFLPGKSNYQAVFGNLELSYNDIIYFNASLRSDWWSKLYGTGQLYILYPSFGTSIILSNLFKINPDIISFAKIRANYTNVGNPPPAYVTGVQTYPVSNGSPDFSNGVKPSLKLQPEKTKGYEFGLNLKFWKNHFNLDVTLYDTDTYNQIFNVPISSSSFYSSFYINAGQVNNRGIEASLGFNTDLGPVKWESNLTYSLNRNKVVKLIENYYDEDSKIYITKDIIDKGGAGSYSNKIKVGGSLNDVYVSTLKHEDQDRYLVIDKGKVVPDNNNFIYAGQAAPNYNLGLRNSFTWGNFNLAFSINARVGGIVVSATQAMLDSFGVSEESAKARDRGYVVLNNYKLPGVKDYYTILGNGLNGILSEYVYDATNVRLRDLSIGYTIPGDVFRNIISSMTLSLTGQNLIMFYNRAPFDPELTASTGTYYQGFDYFMQPSLRSVGFNIKVKF